MHSDHLLTFIIYWQGYWNSYGTDWEGPIPLEDDLETVHVDQLPCILSEEQKATLLEQIVLTDTLTEEWMIKNFAIAKDFVHNAHDSVSL